jgi:hypothetical protein
MNAFRVWLRPSDGVCQLRVDGIENTKWLLDRLSRSFVFKTAQPVNEDQGPSFCTFRVAYSPRMSPSRFERLLGAIPEVQLMSDPA